MFGGFARQCRINEGVDPFPVLSHRQRLADPSARLTDSFSSCSSRFGGISGFYAPLRLPTPRQRRTARRGGAAAARIRVTILSSNRLRRDRFGESTGGSSASALGS